MTTQKDFFSEPILNAPYEYPVHHWELDEDRQPTNRIIDYRRPVSFITPIPKAKKQSKAQKELVLDEGRGLSTEGQQYDPEPVNDNGTLYGIN